LTAEGHPMTPQQPLDLATTFLRLRPDASVEPLPVDDTFWKRLMTGVLGSFHNEFMVASGSHEKDWPNWEMHPHGDEVVCLLSGSVTFILEAAGGTREVQLHRPGSYVLVPKGVWHTAKTQVACQLLFITPGEGTQHRPAA